jgi:hypothetical protein
MPHRVSLSRIVVGGSFACAVFLTIASSLAQVALGASEIVSASPGGKKAAGLRLTLHVAHVGAFSVINASAPPHRCIGTILSPPLSNLSTPGAGAFPLSCSPPHFGSASVAQPFVSSNAGGYSDDRDALRFAMFFCVIMTVSISSSYRIIQRLLFILVPITAAFVIIPVLSTLWSFESFVSVRALEPLFFLFANPNYASLFKMIISTVFFTRVTECNSMELSAPIDHFFLNQALVGLLLQRNSISAVVMAAAHLLGPFDIKRLVDSGLRLVFMQKLCQNQQTNDALALFATSLIAKFLTCSVWPAWPSMRFIWLMPKLKSLKSWMACLVFASIIFMSPLCVKGGLPVSSPQLTKPLHMSHFHCFDSQTHSCAILNGGAVKCWGKVHNSNTGYSTPVEVEGLSSGVVSLALGRVRFIS